jgi:hypothetical protein
LETSRLPHFLDGRLTNAGEVVSLARLPRFVPRKISGTHLLDAEPTTGPYLGSKDELNRKKKSLETSMLNSVTPEDRHHSYPLRPKMEAYFSIFTMRLFITLKTRILCNRRHAEGIDSDFTCHFKSTASLVLRESCACQLEFGHRRRFSSSLLNDII